MLKRNVWMRVPHVERMPDNWLFLLSAKDDFNPDTRITVLYRMEGGIITEETVITDISLRRPIEWVSLFGGTKPDLWAWCTAYERADELGPAARIMMLDVYDNKRISYMYCTKCNKALNQETEKEKDNMRKDKDAPEEVSDELDQLLDGLELDLDPDEPMASGEISVDAAQDALEGKPVAEDESVVDLTDVVVEMAASEEPDLVLDDFSLDLDEDDLSTIESIDEPLSADEKALNLGDLDTLLDEEDDKAEEPAEDEELVFDLGVALDEEDEPTIELSGAETVELDDETVSMLMMDEEPMSLETEAVEPEPSVVELEVDEPEPTPTFMPVDYVGPEDVTLDEEVAFSTTIVKNKRTGRFHLRTGGEYSEDSWASFTGAMGGLVHELSIYMLEYQRELDAA